MCSRASDSLKKLFWRAEVRIFPKDFLVVAGIFTGAVNSQFSQNSFSPNSVVVYV